MAFSAHSYLLLVFSTTFQEASDTPLFSSPASLTICTVLQLFTVICSQPSSAVSITAAENYALYAQHAYFSFWKLELPCPGAQYCASVHKSPLLPQQAGVTVAQRLCTVVQTVLLTHMEQFIHLQKLLIGSIRRHRPSTCMDNEKGIRWSTARLSSRTSFIYLLLPLCHTKLVCDANSPSPSCIAEQPQST